MLENQDYVVYQEAWGTWACQVLKEKGELWDSQVEQEDQASQVFTVSREIRESRVIQKVQGQDHQDQRGIQDCRVKWERKEKWGNLAHLDIRGLLDLREPLEVLEVLASQESQVLMVTWVLKESEASRALQESKALQVFQDSQDLLDQWV